MNTESRLAFLRAQDAKRSNGGKAGIKKAKLNRELAMKPDESIGDRFPDAHAKLTDEILARLPPDQPGREKFASGVARYMMGDPAAKVEAQMGMNYSLIHTMMNMAFPSKDEMLKVMESTMSGAAIVATGIFMQKAHEMNGRDAAQAASLFTRSTVDLKREREGKPAETLNVNLIVKLQSAVESIKQLKEGKVHDV